MHGDGLGPDHDDVVMQLIAEAADRWRSHEHRLLSVTTDSLSSVKCYV